MRSCAPPEFAHTVGESLCVTRQKIRDAMRAYMQIEDPTFALLIPAPPGSGKTWAGVEHAWWIHQQMQRRVFYAGPRHDFFTDIAICAAEQQQPPGNWYEWLPRQRDDDHAAKHTCNHAEAINLWLHKNFAGMDFCSQVCGWDYVNRGCPYHAQKKRMEPIIYGQHAHIPLGHPLAHEFACVIGDENPLTTFVHEWRIPTKHIHWSALPVDEPLTHLLWDMQRICENGARLQGFDLMKMFGSERVLHACKNFIMPVDAAVLAPVIRDDQDAERAPYNLLPTLMPILLREAEASLTSTDYPSRLWLTEHGLTILTRRHVNEQFPKHMIWFDATGRRGLYEAILECDVEVVDVRPQLTGKIFQVTDRANGKSTLIRQDGAPHHARMAQTKAQVEKIAGQYQNPAIVTYQGIEGEFSGQDTLHFYGARGSNQMQECDALIVVGTPQPPLYQIEKIAKSLWPTRMRPFDTRRYMRDRAYRYVDKEGNGWSYPVSVFADEELNELLWQYREAEIIQAAHRARILFRDVPVYLLSNIPIDELPPTELLTIREVMGAPVGVDVFLWERLIEFVNKLANQNGLVASSDLIEKFGISKPTALKYMDMLIDSGDWEPAIIRQKAEGRSPRALKKRLV
jgi:hypothetical protein